MKYCLLLILLVVTSCGGNTKPTPFTAGKPAGVPQGCKDLRQEVEEYNKTHDKKHVADC